MSVLSLHHIASALIFSLVLAPTVFADDATPRFGSDVQPLLKKHCLKCHGPAKREAKLNLSTPGGIVRGGMNGAVLVPHDLNASLLWKRVDAGLIDGLVNGAGALAGGLAQRLRPVQTGFVRHYALLVLAGAVAIVSYLLWP